MIKPDWEIFNTKFSENPQKSFEWFCYLLFCKEFDKPTGIFSYFNQANIETDPISDGNDVIGWQAKFYSSNTLSPHKDEILKMLGDAKKYYPDLTKILFYTNSEWGQTKGEPPKAKIEIENEAKQLKITLVWRTASFFESEFVCLNNKDISEYFFILSTDNEKMILKLKYHTSTILGQIHTEIKFNEYCIKLDRDAEITTITDKNNMAVIVHGEAGTGKTAVVKMLYEKHKDRIPFYIFRAMEFNKSDITQLLPHFSLDNFIDIHSEELDKIVVIDSAEKLMDLDYSEPIKDFLFKLKESNWKIIFTTRNFFLEELIFKFLEEYEIVPQKVHIQNISEKQLSEIFQERSISLPSEFRLKKLLETPFYLNEYFKLISGDEIFDYLSFKTKLWLKTIGTQNEDTFVSIAVNRANAGSYYVHAELIDTDKYDTLIHNGVLGKESGCYFIAHDIYEEWALDKFIDQKYLVSIDEFNFLESIGSSLPIRRSYRCWLSEKLAIEDADILRFIQQIIPSENIENYWKDETIIAVLLSDYAIVFFQQYRAFLLKDDFGLLRRVAFLLQLGCKETDNKTLLRLGIQNYKFSGIEWAFVHPKGSGWNAFINFIFLNKNVIGFDKIGFVIPVLFDWTCTFFEGDTTKDAALIALEFYEWIQDREHRYHDTNEKVFKIICNGSKEIKAELIILFDQVVQKKWYKHSDSYADFVKAILADYQYHRIVTSVPDSIISLADLFWSIQSNPNQSGEYGHHSLSINQYFGLEDHSGYSSPSALQTPVLFLLKVNFVKTRDFIINFTNKCVQNYQASDFDQSAQEISFLSRDKEIIQVSSRCLWNVYRGTSSPVSPNLLQSMHMALENFLFLKGKELESSMLEDLLFHIIEKSQSVSLTAIVSIIVLAYPEKTFNVARTLFGVKEFIQLDFSRKCREHEATTLYRFGPYDIHMQERLATCEEKHRQDSLESLFLKYQIINIGNVTNDEVNERRERLHELLDTYNDELPPVHEQTGDDKNWRSALARMDLRKQNVTKKNVNNQVAYHFQTEFEPDLKSYQEESSQMLSHLTDHIQIRNWSNDKWKKNQKAEEYNEYDVFPSIVIAEIKEICKKLKENPPQKISLLNISENGFSLHNSSTPSIACSCLIRDYFETLEEDEKEFCKDIILEFAFQPLQPNYCFQSGDGTEQAIAVLGKIFLAFPNEYTDIKIAILFNLFRDGAEAEFGRLCREDAIETLGYLIENEQFLEFKSFLLGYRFLKPRYEEFCNKYWTLKQHKKSCLEFFIDENQSLLDSFVEKKLELSDNDTFDDLSLGAIDVIMHLFTIKLPEEKWIVINIISRAVNILEHLVDNSSNNIAHRYFWKKYSRLLLQSSEEDLVQFLEPFLLSFSGQEFYSAFFQEVIYVQDSLQNHANFWKIWYLFKPKIIDLYQKNKSNLGNDKIIKVYLFAETRWNQNLKEWATLQPCDNLFFKEIVDEIGRIPAVLYSLNRLLCGAGSCYLKEGIDWIKDIIQQYEVHTKISGETISDLEYIMRKYITQNQDMIKKNVSVKTKITIILSFLVENGSVVGYMLRDRLL